MWISFLEHPDSVNRLFLDLSEMLYAQELEFFSNASANGNLGFGTIFGNHWLSGQWESGFISAKNPSIEFLELYALTTAVLTWSKLLQKTRIVIFCDNQSVVFMINNMTSSCQYCMELLRVITLDNLHANRRIFCLTYQR